MPQLERDKITELQENLDKIVQKFTKAVQKEGKKAGLFLEVHVKIEETSKDKA